MDRRPSVLFLCTGNLCRSPMAAAFVNQRSQLAGAQVRASSAGYLTQDRHPPPETLRVMSRRGIDLSEHLSRKVTPELLDEADLVLGMARIHIWDAALMEPEVIPRAFVLGELVRLNRLADGRSPGEKFEDWIARLHGARKHGVTSVLATDEVPDPYGRRERVHERVARAIDSYVLGLADCAFDPAQPLHHERWRDGKIVWRA